VGRPGGRNVNPVPQIRIRTVNQVALAPEGDYVLYWMIAFRRIEWNFALQHACAMAQELDRPLVVLEALRCDYPWASDRLHRFILEGMADNARRMATRRAFYYPYLEQGHGAGKGLLEALAKHACLVVTDDFPAFFLPRMIAAAGAKLAVRLEAVDSNGLLPLRVPDKAYPAAYHFRRLLQKELRGHLAEPPQRDPLQQCALPMLENLPAKIAARWPAPGKSLLEGSAKALSALPIDHTVAPASFSGGARAARQRLNRFISRRLADYGERQSDPQADATSGLSPYLHFGHIAAHEIFARIAEHEGWNIGDLAPETRGKRHGWWRMSEGAESFLDQLVTWRELGFNTCVFTEGYGRYEALPAWARETLSKHADDPRPYLYTREDLEQAQTHDEIWNAAQMQLVREGRVHNYLRMLWGKKILEWTCSPQEALEVMTELNNKYALDGRGPNSCSGIFWCLGRYDHPWQERPIFGKVRTMTSKNTAKKYRLDRYIRTYAPNPKD